METMNEPSSSSRWAVSSIGRVYLVLVVAESFAIIGSAIGALDEADENDNASGIRYVAILSIYVTVGCLVFAVDSVVTENVFQFWSAYVVHSLMTLYVIWHWHTDNLGSFFHKYSFVMMIVICILEGIYLIMGRSVHATFGWRLYKHIGGNVHLQECYKTYQIFLSLLKLDLFLGALLVILAYFYLLSDEVELITNIIALVVTAGWALLGWRAAVLESSPMVWIFTLFAFVEPTYIAYKLYDIDAHPSKYPEATFTQFVITGSIACAVRLGVVVWCHWVRKNFGGGLRNKVFLRHKELSQSLTQNAYSEIRDYTRPLCSCDTVET